MDLFSERHREDIENGGVCVSMPSVTRLKLIDCMKRYNVWDGMAVEDSLFFGKLKQVVSDFHKDYPQKFYIEDTMKRAGSMDQFMLEIRGEYMFDAMELYSRLIDPFRRDLFHEECNYILSSGNLPYKFKDGSLSCVGIDRRTEPDEYGFRGPSSIKRVIRFFD
jgi:hypothetical protein